jgi:hypothetical protein
MLRLGAAQWSEAERHYTEALGLAEALGARSTVAASLIGLGELALRRGDPDTAARQLEQGRDICRTLGFTRMQTRAERLLAEVRAGAKQLA